MQRRNPTRTTSEIWLERILWNAAAFATLALLVALLLLSFSWLDRLDPEGLRRHAESRSRPSFELEESIDRELRQLANRPRPGD